MRRSLVGGVFMVLASLLLGSCGGGGAGNPNPVGGTVTLLPNNGTLFAGVEYTFTVAGGRPPYFLSSSEASVLSVPFSISGHTFTVIPANTAVVDANLPPNSLPVRTVTLSARDSTGQTATTGDTLQVAMNFLTGYNVLFTSNCPGTGTAAGPSFCAGGETAVEITAAISGNLYGNREYRFEVVRGPIYFQSIPGTGNTPPSGTLGPGGTTWTTRTDHEGDAHAIIRVNNNVGTQLGVFRVVDVATGASTQHVFGIEGVPLSGALTAIPDEFTLTGPNSASCGTGSGDFLVFDGTPPYTAESSFPQFLIVTPETSTTQPGRFRFAATNPNFCLDSASIIIRDANNRTVTVEVSTEPGSGDPPPPPISPTPGSLTLACGQSGSVILTGGGGTFTASSPDTRLTSSLATRVLTITRVATDPVGVPPSPTPGVANPGTFTVNVTDGTNLVTIGVSAPTNCPP